VLLIFDFLLDTIEVSRVNFCVAVMFEELAKFLGQAGAASM
jgi:hypothetical protein